MHAFERFEEVVDTRSIRSFEQLRLAFSYWAGERWIESSRQLHALSIEARRLGLLPFVPTFRVTYVMVRGHLQERLRDIRTGRFIRRT
jgi:hypothetical protein